MARAAARERGHAQRPVHRPGRHRLRPDGLLRQPDPDAEHRRAREERAAVQQHAHDGAVLADALVHPDRPQSSLERDGVHHRRIDRLSGRQRLHPVRERIPVRDPAAEGLQHLRARQVAPDACGSDLRGWSLRSLAPRTRLRAVLRLPRRRHAPVLPGARRTTITASSRRRRRTRAITSPKISWTTPSASSPTPSRTPRTSRSSCTSRPARRHAPHHVPKEWADKYKGQFDGGWDAFA